MAARDAAPFKRRLSEAMFGLASRGEPSVLFVVPGHWRGLQRGTRPASRPVRSGGTYHVLVAVSRFMVTQDAGGGRIHMHHMTSIVHPFRSCRMPLARQLSH